MATKLETSANGIRVLKKGDTPRVMSINLSGYKTIEIRAVPDGNIIPLLSLALEKEPQAQ